MAAEDNEPKWYDAQVVKVYPPMSADPDLPPRLGLILEEVLRVHYLGWSSRFNLFFKRSSVKIAPLFSQTASWRWLCVGDEVECKVNEHWFIGVVAAVDYVAHTALVRPVENVAVPEMALGFMR